MTKYVDGFVLVIPKRNLSAYKKMATEASKVWRKFGATHRPVWIEGYRDLSAKRSMAIRWASERLRVISGVPYGRRDD